MADIFSVPFDGAGRAVVAFTDKSDGDFHLDGDPAERARAAARISALPWSWVRQVHGADVVTVNKPGDGCGRDGDGLVTKTPGAVLSVRGADCPIVALVAPGQAVIGVAHAGWRGLVAGVLQETVAAMEAVGARAVHAYLGPAIGAAHYAFGEDDLARVVARLGPSVVATSQAGGPALDLVAAVEAALGPLGVTVDRSHHRCTATEHSLYSHRARGEAGRHALAAWIEL